MKNLIDHMDELDLIGQRKMLKGQKWIEGGDSLQRTGFIAIAQSFGDKRLAKSQFLDRMKHHEVEDGLFVRHPDLAHWYSRPNTTSRDQLTPVVVACGLLNCRHLLRRIFFAHVKRLGFYQNWRESDGTFKIADYASPEHWGFYVRSFNAWYLYPLLFISDIFSLVGTLYKVYKYSRTPKNVDDLNRIVSLTQSNLVLPTPISKLSLKIYKKRRSHMPRISGPRYALTRYFGNARSPYSDSESPPLDLEWDLALKTMFE